MIPLGPHTFRGSMPWQTGGGAENYAGRSRHVCAQCGETFLPPSTEYMYREGKRWFCRYQHLADWRKAHPKRPPVKRGRPADAWKETQKGCRERLKYCRNELALREQTIERAQAAGDRRMYYTAQNAATRWRSEIKIAEECLRALEIIEDEKRRTR